MMIQNSLTLLSELTLIEDKICFLEEQIKNYDLKIDFEDLLLVVINNRFNSSN